MRTLPEHPYPGGSLGPKSGKREGETDPGSSPAWGGMYSFGQSLALWEPDRSFSGPQTFLLLVSPRPIGWALVNRKYIPSSEIVEQGSQRSTTWTGRMLALLRNLA